MNVEFSESREVFSFPADVYPVARRQATGMMSEEELLNLVGALAAYAWPKDSIFVEIGAYVGSTTVFVAKVMQILEKTVPILSIDPFERFQPDTEELINMILRENSVRPHLIGKETNFERQLDENIDHVRTLTTGLLYVPDHYEKAKLWAEEAMREGRQRIAEWRRES